MPSGNSGMDLPMFHRLTERDNHFLLERLFVIVMLFLLAIFYYYDILNSWFFYDDPSAIAASTGSVREIFIENSYSYAFYTPLVALSFKPDAMIFGMNPLPYRIHNVIVLVVIAFMVYLISRRYTDRLSSLLSALIVLFSTPSLVCIFWITLRQYLYSMLFALMAIYLYLKYKPELRQDIFIIAIILISCELSFMGKEQFMTLPFVLFALSEGSFKQRIYKTYPYFLLLIGHFLFRWHILGGMGGYVGVSYQARVYLKTIAESILIASKVMFGFSWVIIISALPFFLKPKRIILSILIWLVALSVSFLQMSFYPSADTYRYWFIPVILFSFFITFNVSLIKGSLPKTLYFLIILSLFLNQSLKTNKDLKIFFRKESLTAQKVSESMLDNRYHNTLFLFPDSRYIVESSYIYSMAEAYLKVSGVKSFAAFYPVELLAFFPEIIRDFENIYEIKEKDAVDISSSVEKRINSFKATVSDEKPESKLFRDEKRIEISLKCRSAKSITVYSLRRLTNEYYIKKAILPYLDRINLAPYVRNKEAEVIPIEKLSYNNKIWHLDDRPIKEDTLLIIAFCIDNHGRYTLPSDVLYIHKPRRS